MAQPAEHGTFNQDAREEGKATRRLDRLRAIENNRRILDHNCPGACSRAAFTRRPRHND